MKDHVTEMHNNPGDNVELTGPFRTVLRNVLDPSSFRQVLFALDEMFYVIWDIRDNTFYCATFHVGPKDNSCKFKYKFSISKKGGESLSCCLTTCSFMDNVEDVIKSGKCVAIHYGSVENFIKNGTLPFEIHIFYNDPSKSNRRSSESDYVIGDFNEDDGDDIDDNEMEEEVESN